MSDILDHYRSLATVYDEHWLYSDDFVTTLAKKIASALELDSSDLVVDIGCGTGIYARALSDVAKLDRPIICADPSEAMLNQMTDNSGLECVVADALTLLGDGVDGDKFLMKEVVHHIVDKQRLFESIAQTLRPGGIFLILLLPPKIEYPLFEAALRCYEEVQPDYHELIDMATTAGLTAEAWIESIPLAIEKSRYLRMIAGRYMSLLSMFTDTEIREGVREVDERYPDGPLLFDDRFVFLRLSITAEGEFHA